jgi:hypothetical protein
VAVETPAVFATSSSVGEDRFEVISSLLIFEYHNEEKRKGSAV